MGKAQSPHNLAPAPLILPSAAATGAASRSSLKGPSPGRGPLSRTPLSLALYSQAWQPCLLAGFSSKVSLVRSLTCPHRDTVLACSPAGLPEGPALCVPFSLLLTHRHHLVCNICLYHQTVAGRDPVDLWPARSSVSWHRGVERLQRKSRYSSSICHCRRMDAFELRCWEKTLESSSDCKEIQPVHPKGNRS